MPTNDPEPPAATSNMTSEEKLNAMLKRLDDLEAAEASEAKKRRLEWFRIGIPSGIAVVTIVIGFIQYISTSSCSSRQPYLTKQTELCLQASEHTARLASTSDRAQWDKSRGEFWMLWIGPLEVVQEAGSGSKSRVADEMIAFGHELEK